MRAAAVILSCALWGCHETVVLPAPELDPATKSVLLLASGEGAPWIHAADLSDSPLVLPPLHRVGTPMLETVEFRCPLARLGLQPGDQTLGEAAPSLRLPLPARVQQLHPDRATWTEGQLSEESAGLLAKLELDEDNLCRATQARFRSTELPFPPDGRNDPGFNLQLDERRAFVSSRNGHYYVVDRDGSIEAITPFDEPKEYAAGHRMPDGELWLISLQGELVRGTLDSGFQTVTSSAPLRPAERMYLAGPKVEGAPLELYLLTDARDFLRFDGARWEVLATSDKFDGVYRPEIAWLRPREAVAISVGRSRNTVTRYRDGEVLEERIGDDVGLSAIAEVPGIGLTVGRDDGGILFRGDRAWIESPHALDTFFVRAITPLDGGFFYGAGLSYGFFEYHVFQYFPSTGHCPPERLSRFPMTHVTKLDDDFYVGASLGNFNDPLDLTLLEIEERSATCTE